MPPEKELIQAIESCLAPLVEDLAAARFLHKRESEKIELVLAQKLDAVRREGDQRLEKLRQAHRDQLGRLKSELQQVEEQAGGTRPWNDACWSRYVPATQAPEVVRVGTHRLVLGGGEILETPAFIPFRGGRSLLIEAAGSAKQQAIEAAQAFVIRLLALTPPSKLKLLLLDPVGLGENVAQFMHLCDHIPELVTHKAWSDRKDIEDRLKDLSDHVEMVIQSYLRGAYRTLEEYNQAAEEVREPYRVIVAVNFPVNFTEDSARRLVSIVTNGPKCGVFSVIIRDTEQELPRGFNLLDIKRASHVLSQTNKGFQWWDKAFSAAQYELDAPPPPKLFESLVNSIGRAATEASKTQLPFHKIAPAPEKWWGEYATEGLRAPIGRAGARKFQHFELGQGTAHHALIAGRTGSGKSTLLHVLITSLAIRYAPDELELYLVDFKSGVEFKDYATYKLPHARVIAIASEREFGRSVLEKLAAEMNRRGDLFRAVGCASLEQYREMVADPQNPPAAKLPRILLLVDEFQQFFVPSNDAIATRAGQLLDQLVRQGRSFGMHVLLGSQTLKGAYTLHHSTMGQMGVRIALQCSEEDSRVILSEDNPAARLLKRPGESLYNAESGQKEANSPFQVAWLAQDERRRLLQQVQVKAGECEFTARLQTVFDGNSPARLEDQANHPLQELLALPDWPLPSSTSEAWVGEPIAIDSPTTVSFSNNPCRHLLIVGQNEQLATGIVLSVLLSVVTRHRPDRAQFFIADFTPAVPDKADFAEHFRSLVPHQVHSISRRTLEEKLRELAAMVQERHKNNDVVHASCYLIMLGLQRARELRQEQGSGLRGGRDGSLASVNELFRMILKDGAEVGVHVAAWSDSGKALSQVVPRGNIGLFEMRVAMTMSEDDSHGLINCSEAKNLSGSQALLFDEERPAELRRFRPYQTPPPEWLQQIGRKLNARLSP